MNDLINRKDAIDAFAKLVPYVIDNVLMESYANGLTDAYNLICQLPSVEPDRKAKAEMLEEPFRTSMTWEGKCSNSGCYTIHEMNYCFGCGVKLYWGE